MLPSDTEDAQLTETEGSDEETPSEAPSHTTASESNLDDQGDDDDDEYTEDEEDDEEDDEWEPSSAKTPKGRKPHSPSVSPSPPKARYPAASKASSKQPRVSKLAQDMNKLEIKGHSTGNIPLILSNEKH